MVNVSVSLPATNVIKINVVQNLAPPNPSYFVFVRGRNPKYAEAGAICPVEMSVTLAIPNNILRFHYVHNKHEVNLARKQVHGLKFGVIWGNRSTTNREAILSMSPASCSSHSVLSVPVKRSIVLSDEISNTTRGNIGC